MKKLLQDRQSIKLGVFVAVAFPLIYFLMNFLGLSNGMFSWWETLLFGLVQGVIFWFCMASFRQFREEDITPR
ncbi:hypothetical protein [Brevibacterium sediminis]|uniref:Uncharacterized protein n=1 Tax=Brevibacterium sediminis TaxID=1857024 RepID=A0A5C4X4S0_9MICO|nr:hypothetical protein [Brevibacterium sediminis]TNM56755.1 hypothetical protein FHQ09_04000 [Brevibacterium sediminis]